MSTLRTNSITGTSLSKWTVDIGANSYLYSAGMILQTVYVRMDAQTTYSSPATGNGTTVAGLAITITPKRSSSLLLCTWMINCEITENNVFLVHRDGSLITTAGYQAYNNVAGNSRWSGVMAPFYDWDTNSTLSNHILQYVIPATATTTTTIAPAIRSSDGNARTLYMNRTAITPQNSYEISVSSGMIQEIAQ